MAWAVTANLDEFQEAFDWLSSRVPYTTAQLDALDDKARARAFTIAGQVELTTVQTIFDEIKHAQAHGTSLEEFKKRVAEKLGDKVGPNGYHLETVFRNWTQQAYNTGRWYQITDPELIALRPFICFDATLDSRTTRCCSDLDGTIKPVEDPFWLTHHPILHMRCRSSLRSLRTSQAERAGISTTDPMVEIPEGFGLAPPLRGDGTPGPDQRRFDPEVWDAFLKRQADSLTQLEAANQNALKLRAERDRQDPEFWKEELVAKYGEEAGSAIAWGRAMEYRGRALSLEEAQTAHEALADVGAQVAPDARDIFHRAESTREVIGAAKVETLGELIDVFAEAGELHATLETELRATASLLGHAQSIEAAPVKIPAATGLTKRYPAPMRDRIKADHKAVAKWLGKLTDESVARPEVRVEFIWGRASYLPRRYAGGGRIRSSGRPLGSDLAHEWGHALEDVNERTQRAATSFLAQRTAADAPQYLSVLTGNERYSSDERAKPDHFFNPYMGKLYQGGETELVSMGIELLRTFEGAKLYSKDPEHFWLTLGILAGGKVP